MELVNSLIPEDFEESLRYRRKFIDANLLQAIEVNFC
jgi:hypothetical protein